MPAVEVPSVAPRQRRSTLPLLAALTVLILLAAGGWWAYPRIMAALAPETVQTAESVPSPTAPPSPARPVTPTTPAPAAADPGGPRLDRLEHTVGELAPKTALATLDGDIAALDQRLSALEAKPPAEEGASVPDPSSAELQHLSADMAQLAQRIAALEVRTNQRTVTIRADRALVLAAGQIQAALASSAPFDTPVAMIRAVTPGDKLLDGPLTTLETHAKAGIASRIVLAQQLSALPDHLADPAPVAADAGFWDRVSGRLGSLVRIRRVDDRAGIDGAPEGPDRRIADAQADLAAGDLAGAVKAIAGLTGKAAIAAKPWLAAAEARLDCEQAAAVLETEMAQRLSAGPAAAP
jgi:uroporphyrinogen-III synthase